MTIEWKDSYALGDAQLDAQHQHLFALARQMVDAQDINVVKRLAVELYKHTRIHFEYEEGEMRKAGFPGLAAHIESHLRLLGRFNTLSLEIGKGKLDKAALDALMTDWALYHIPLDDAQFETFLKARG